jgi:UDP-glucose 4-epimerase
MTSAPAAVPNPDNAQQYPEFEFVKADIVDADLIGLLADLRPEVVFHSPLRSP